MSSWALEADSGLVDEILVEHRVHLQAEMGFLQLPTHKPQHLEVGAGLFLFFSGSLCHNGKIGLSFKPC